MTAELPQVITAMLRGDDHAVADFVGRQHYDRLAEIVTAGWTLVSVVHQLQWHDTPTMMEWKAPEQHTAVPLEAFRPAMESAATGDKPAALQALSALSLDQLATVAFLAWSLRSCAQMRLDGRYLPSVLETEPDPQGSLFE